jgi:hypothetical protein
MQSKFGSRKEQDDFIWVLHLAQPPNPGPPPNYRGVTDFEQLATFIGQEPDDFGHPSWVNGWSSFLHSFFFFKQVSFFGKRPPALFTIEEQAFLAASAEILCNRFNLQVPDWVSEPDYVLPELSAPVPWLRMQSVIKDPAATAHPTYLKHNVIARDRDLLVL